MPSYLLRLISAAFLIPVMVTTIWIGGWALNSLLIGAFMLSLYEWNMLTIKLTPSSLKRIILNLIGMVYLAIPFYFLSTIEHLMGDDGKKWLLFLFISIWSSDSLAYIMGKNIGGAKMSPTVSPNKTWSGYAGALIAPALTLSICIHFLTPLSLSDDPPSVFSTLIVGMVMGIVGQSGDLLISFIKRKAGAKDTGKIIPGHGGILDRIDSLLLVTPVFYAYIVFLSGVIK